MSAAADGPAEVMVVDPAAVAPVGAAAVGVVSVDAVPEAALAVPAGADAAATTPRAERAPSLTESLSGCLPSREKRDSVVLLDIGGAASRAPPPGARLPAAKQQPTRWQVPVPRPEVPDLLEVLSEQQEAAAEAVEAEAAAAAVEVDDPVKGGASSLPVDAQPVHDGAASGPSDTTKAKPQPIYHDHPVDPRKDSLLSLSLRYKIPVAELRRENPLISKFSDNVASLGFVRVRLQPGAIPTILSAREEALRKLVLATKLSRREAGLYLDEAEGAYEAALAAARADLEWEAEQKAKEAQKTTFEVELPAGSGPSSA